MKKILYSWLNILLGIVGSLLFLPVFKENTSDSVFALWMVLLNFSAFGILLANGLKSTSMRYLIYFEDEANEIGSDLRDTFGNRESFDRYLMNCYKQAVIAISIVFWFATVVYLWVTVRISVQFVYVVFLVYLSMLVQLISGRWSSYLEAWNMVEEYQRSLAIGSLLLVLVRAVYFVIDKNVLNFALLFVLGTVIQQLFVRSLFVKNYTGKVISLNRLEDDVINLRQGVNLFTKSLLKSSMTNVFAGGIKYVIPVVISSSMIDARASLFLLVKRVMEVFEKVFQSTFQVFYPRIVQSISSRAVIFTRIESALSLLMILTILGLEFMSKLNPTSSVLVDDIYSSRLIVYFGMYTIINRLLGIRMAFLNAYDDIVDVYVIPLYAGMSLLTYWFVLKQVDTYYLPLSYVVSGKILLDTINLRIYRRYQATFRMNFIISTLMFIYIGYLLVF